MSTVYIFHGTGGKPEENWFPWLKRELEAHGHTVHVPQFPTPEHQTPEEWMKVFEVGGYTLDDDTILIGHSLGGTFLLRLLEEKNATVRAAFFIGSPIGILPIRNIETDRPFLVEPFDWEILKARAATWTVFHSDNDPFVGVENAHQLSRNLGANLVLIPGAGHFNRAAGYTEFPELLERILLLDFFNVRLETERLRLVPVSMEYAPLIFNEFTDEVTHFMYPATPKSVADTEAFIRDARTEMKAGSDVTFVILSKTTDEFLGCAGAHSLNTRHPELGVWVKKSAHGNHYGREAVTAIKQWIDEHIPYEHLVYPVAEQNTASRKVAESLGGVVHNEYDKTTLNGKTWHYLDYWITR